jgi:hypothetical protein
MATEPGLDLHEWETRWSALQEEAAASPAEALPEVVALLAEMLETRGIDVDDPVALEGDDPTLVQNFLAAREIAAATTRAPVEQEDIDAAYVNLRELYAFLTDDRAAP